MNTSSNHHNTSYSKLEKPSHQRLETEENKKFMTEEEERKIGGDNDEAESPMDYKKKNNDAGKKEDNGITATEMTLHTKGGGDPAYKVI